VSKRKRYQNMPREEFDDRRWWPLKKRINHAKSTKARVSNGGRWGNDILPRKKWFDSWV